MTKQSVPLRGPMVAPKLNSLIPLVGGIETFFFFPFSGVESVSYHLAKLNSWPLYNTVSDGAEAGSQLKKCLTYKRLLPPRSAQAMCTLLTPSSPPVECTSLLDSRGCGGTRGWRKLSLGTFVLDMIHNIGHGNTKQHETAQTTTCLCHFPYILV